MAAISDISITRLIDFSRSRWQAARAREPASLETFILGCYRI
jgi:hypothetical protein